jgi:hypothetical protein
MKLVLHGTGPQSSVFLLRGCRDFERLPENFLEPFYCKAREGLSWFRRPCWLAKRAVASLFLSGQAVGRPRHYSEYG